jgi:hypothetical protein
MSADTVTADVIATADIAIAANAVPAMSAGVIIAEATVARRPGRCAARGQHGRHRQRRARGAAGVQALLIS